MKQRAGIIKCTTSSMKITLIQPGKKKKNRLHKLLFDTGLIYFIFINHLFKILNKSARQLCHLSASFN